MAYNFNEDVLSPLAPDSRTDGTENDNAESTQAPAAAATPAEAPTSPGFTRFNSCRWQQPKEDGNAAFCTHREVKPYAGSTSFDADAWCPECQHYKLRRAPKKRTSEDYSY